MRTLRLVLLLLLAATAVQASVLRIRIDDMIHPISDEFVERAIAEAQQSKAQALLIELRTPGGLEDSMRKIVESFFASPVPVIVYVSPGGARAASAGFFILEAADVAAMAPGTNTGAAHPVMLGGEKVDDVMKAKMENDAAAFMRTIAARRGRNVAVAESAVRQSKSFTEQEALDQKLIDVVAPNVASLLKALDGKTVKRVNGTTVTLHFANQPIVDFDMSLKQRILSKLMDPNIAFILLALGALAVWAELNHPGAVLPGVVGTISILLAVFALNLLPTRYASLALLLAAFVLFALEAKFATHGVLGIGGIICMILGAVFLVDGPIPEMRVHWATAIAVSVPLGLIAMFLMTLVLRARKGRVVTGREGMAGELGVTRTDVAEDGKVFVHGELWNATSAGAAIPAGTRVRVTKVDGLRVIVEPAEESHVVVPPVGHAV